MNLRTFDKTLTRKPIQRDSIPSVTVTGNGRFTFSQGARRLFSFKEGDRVVLHQDKEERAGWYLEFTREKRGYKIVLSATTSRFSCAFGADEIFKSIGKKPFKQRFPIINKPYRQGEKFLYRIDVINPII